MVTWVSKLDKKSPKFSLSKFSLIIPILFSVKNIRFVEQLVKITFDNFNFWNSLFSKIGPYFCWLILKRIQVQSKTIWLRSNLTCSNFLFFWLCNTVLQKWGHAKLFMLQNVETFCKEIAFIIFNVTWDMSNMKHTSHVRHMWFTWITCFKIHFTKQECWNFLQIIVRSSLYNSRMKAFIKYHNFLTFPACF